MNELYFYQSRFLGRPQATLDAVSIPHGSVGAPKPVSPLIGPSQLFRYSVVVPLEVILQCVFKCHKMRYLIQHPVALGGWAHTTNLSL